MIAAVQAGADVYCQKPISVDVVEGQAMVAAARKYKRVVQVGTHRRSTRHYQEAKERVVRAGLLGNVKYVETCCYWHARHRQSTRFTSAAESRLRDVDRAGAEASLLCPHASAKLARLHGIRQRNRR